MMPTPTLGSRAALILVVAGAVLCVCGGSVMGQGDGETRERGVSERPGALRKDALEKREAVREDASERRGTLAAGADAQQQDGEKTFSVAPLWTAEQTPVDFLEAVGQVTKARWRQLYRPPPPIPAPDRLRSAVTLGYLLGESYLCVQAADAQQFRNNNQEVMAFSRTLGFGEKVSPMLLGQAKLAEDGMWEDLRTDVIRGQQVLHQALLDQRDEDLAVLLDLGVWLRTLEIVSSLVLETPDADVGGLCVGSPLLIEELRKNFATLPETMRENEEVAKELGMLLEFLWRNWARSADVKPPPEVVRQTHERLAQAARKVSLR